MKNNRFLRGLVSAGLSAVIALSAVGCGSSSSSAGFNAAEAAEAAAPRAEERGPAGYINRRKDYEKRV